MHSCLTVECITSSLHFLQHCRSVFQSISFNLIRSHPPLWTLQPILVSICLELTIWALVAPGKFFEPGKFATQLISPQLFTFKMLTMS